MSKVKNMDFDWNIWCRFCAKADVNNINIFAAQTTKCNKMNLIPAISKFFNIQFNQPEKMPEVICSECLLVLTSLVTFAARVCKVQEMFKEILKSEEGTAIDLNSLYKKYEIEQDSSSFINMQTAPFSVDLVDELPTDGLESELNRNVNCKDPFDEDSEWEWSGSTDSTTTFESDIPVTKNRTQTENLSNENMPENALNSVVKQSRNEYKYLCKHCPKRFQQFNSFRLHVKKKHGHILPLEEFSCPNCDLVFQKKRLMAQHIKSVHADKTVFICEECGEIMGSKSTLRDHMYTHTNYAPFECKDCGKCFKQKTRLKIHMDIHGEKHICVECGLQLSSRATLYSHSLVHSDVTPHKCDYCGRAFKRSKTLKNHLILHTGLKPYSCDFCDKTFSNGTSCRTHKKRVHPDEFAAQEASGEKPNKVKNIPKLAVLKAVTRTAKNLTPVAPKQSGNFSLGKKTQIRAKTYRYQ
uniref:Zinc finger protein weckle n=1 Tax=Zeugodacus cucurbitae TaxID=28588 RepID=A0A0A1X3N9_ZEUCU